MPWCVVFGCKNNMKATKRAGKDVSYHIFPKNPQRRSAWINSLNRPLKFNADSSYVCSEHFILEDFECYSLKEELLNIKVKRQLKKTAIPSVNIIKSSEEQLKVSNSSNECLNKTNTNKIDLKQHCAVPTCKNIISKLDKPYNGNEIVFHRFPSNNEVFEKWIEFCCCSKEFLLDYQNAQICSEHFDEDDYELNYTTKSIHPVRELKKDAVPHCNGEIKVFDVKNIIDDESVRKRKKIVDKLLADYEEQQKNESHLNGMVAKYPSFFSPKINPNAKLADKLKLLKAIDNPESYSPPKKSKILPLSKSNSEKSELLSSNTSQGNDQVIQVSAVKGGLMLHAFPQIASNVLSSCPVKTGADEEEEIIIVTEDEASCANLSYEEQPKENNTEIIIVTNLKETEDTHRYVESVPKTSFTKINDKHNKYCVQNQLRNNESQHTPSYTAKVLLMEDKGCQVLVPCKGCEHRSLKINKLLRERTRLLKNLNQNSTWKDPDEITTLRKMNGVLSLLLKQCIGEKYNKKLASIRVDLVQDCIERINRGWSMNDTSETLGQVLSSNAYDEFARTFEIINEI